MSTLDLLTFPLLEGCTHFNQLELYYLAGGINLVCFFAPFVVAAKQDHDSHEISGTLCLGITILLTVYNIAFNGILGAVISVAVAFFVFRSKEFAAFGQADFLLLGHLYTCYGMDGVGRAILIVACVVWLLSLAGYLVVMYIRTGVRWHPFKGIMVPAFPSYVVSMAIMAVLRFFLIKPLFFAGF